MKTTIVACLPSCNMCQDEAAKKALYDGKTKLGTWAYMCEKCYKQWGIGLGMGKGQKLILEEICSTDQ